MTVTLEVAGYNSTRCVDDDALGQKEHYRATVVVEGDAVVKISPKISTQILRYIGRPSSALATLTVH